MTPAASFHGVISTICVRGLVKSRRAAILRRRGRHSGPAAAGHRRHRTGEPATALIVCMQYLHHLRLAENDARHAPLRQQVFTMLSNTVASSTACASSRSWAPRRGAACRTPWRPVARRAGTSAAIKFIPPALKGCAGWRCGPEAMITRRWWVRLVHGDSPGISVVKSWDHAGMRATGSHEVIFNHVRVAAEHAVDVWPADAPPAAGPNRFACSPTGRRRCWRRSMTALPTPLTTGW